MKEKANKTSAVPRPVKKVKGTVLFTVVCVMMVLIVFLMGTLALAATANKSAQRSYQREQTKANAKAALDATIEAVNNERGLREQIAKLSTTPMELTVTGADGLEVPVTISIAETRTIYSAKEKKWVTGTIYEMKAVSTMQSTGVSTTYCAYVADDSLTKTGGGTGSGGGGAFVATGKTGQGTGSNKIGTSGFISGGTEIGLDLSPSETYTLDNTAKQMVPFYVNGNLEVGSGAECTVYFNRFAPKMYYAVMGDLTLNNELDFQSSDDFKNIKRAVKYTEIPTVFVGGTMYQVDTALDFNADLDFPINYYVGSVESSAGISVAMRFKGDMYCFDPDKTSRLVNQNSSTALYTWTTNNLKVVDNTGHENATNFGNFYSAGSLIMGMDFQKDVRVAKDVTVSKKSKITGDLVVGGTLTVDADLEVTGNIIAGTIVNNSNIKCDGTIKAVEHPKDGNLNGKSVTVLTGISPDSDLSTNSEVKEYYTTVQQDAGDPSLTWQLSWDQSQIENISITYRKHSIDSSGTDKYSDQWGQQFPSMTNDPAQLDKAALICAAYPEIADIMSHTSEATAKVATVAQNYYDLSPTAAYGQKIYPTYYTRANILKDIIAPPEGASYKYANDLDSLDATATVDTSTDLLDKGYGTEGNPIKASGVLTGSHDKDIYIDSSTESIILDVKDFSLADGSNIYIKDVKNVIFFIEDKMTISNCQFITMDYKDILNSTDSATRTINMIQSEDSKYYPKVYIYAPAPKVVPGPTPGTQEKIPSATLECINNCLITAHVRAPGLRYIGANGILLPNDITYVQQLDYDLNNDGKVDGADVTKKDFASESSLGVIGQLICNEINVQNGFGLIYVTTGTSDDDDDDDDDDDEEHKTATRTVADGYYPMYYNYY